MANYAYLVAIAPTYLVTHAFAVRLGRAVELTGRLQGRSTINLFAGGLIVLVVALTAAMCRVFGIPVGVGAGASAIDIALFGVIALPTTLVVSFATARAIRALPHRRRIGPRRRMNDLLAGLATAIKVLLVVGVLLSVIVWIDLIVGGVGTFGPFDWLMTLVFVPVLIVILVIYVARAQRKVATYAKRLRTPSEDSSDGRARVLYLRPFHEEHRLFAGTQTLDEFLGDEIAKQIGPLVALGNPTDRIAPDGAERQYYGDHDWQAAVERLATAAPCIVAAISASPNTAWELQRVLELGLERRLYLLSPPSSASPAPRPAPAAKAGRIRRALQISGQATTSWLARDWDGLSRELSFGELPSALSPAGQTAWDEFVNTLVACGYTVDIPDPGAGAVVGFEPGGRAVLVERGATSPSGFVQPIVNRAR